MKDRQVEQTLAMLRIPVISTLLHCVAMTVIVFLRSGFGYAYLRPKAIFFAFSWAFTLYSAYSWIEPGKWRMNSVLCIYGMAAIALYWLHLIVTFVTELLGTATHDNDSGKPHTLRILGWFGFRAPPAVRNFWVTWVEPAVVLIAALAVRLPGLDARNLSTWLLLAAPCLWLKEALNYWLQIRQRKRQHDTMEDAREGLNENHAPANPAPLASSRQEKVRRQRMQ